MRRYGLVALSALVVLALSLCSCSGPSPPATGTGIVVRVVATQGFGGELLFDEAVEVAPGTSAMAALVQVAEVETAYGGGFVNAIDGVSSQYTGSGGAKQDWFFYVNGISSRKGAADYTLHDGDTQHWDFHQWDFRMSVPAIVGDFPQPFVDGYGGQAWPTVVVYEDGLEEAAQELEGALAALGVVDVSSQHWDSLTADCTQGCNLVCLGLPASDMVSELNAIWDRLGFFVHFEGDTMVVYDAGGEVEARYGAGCGLVQATQSPWHPGGVGACQGVVWVVSGTDEAGVRGAVDALLTRQDEMRYAFAIVVDTDSGEIVRVPR